MRKFFKAKHIILIAILVLAAFFRLYNLSTVPPSPSLDEASIGYNAYSILKTGADEYDTKFPMLLRAYDDWRPALYVYLVIPFVQIFGLDVIAVRLPSVILSILTVVATYFLTRDIFPKPYLRYTIGNWKLEIPEVAALLLAISPWHIYISRLGHEANAGLAFFVFALFFFFKKSYPLATFFFVLSFVSYQAEKVFIPLIIIAVVVIFGKEVWKSWRPIAIGILVSSIVFIPFILATFSPNALIRFKATSIFEANRDVFSSEAIKFSDAKQQNDIVGQILHNRRIAAVGIFAKNYLVHFNPTWLFTNPSNDKHKVPFLGLFYYWELPFIIIGFYILFIKYKKLFMFLTIWVLAAPLAGALTTDAPHAMRSYTFLPSWQIAGAVGLVTICDSINKNTIKYFFLAVILMLCVVSTVYLYKQYFLVFPKEQSSSFQYSLFRAIPFVLTNEKSYNQIIVSNENNLYQSYMIFLYQSQYDPWRYQKFGGTKSGGYAETHSFDKYEFRPVDFKKEHVQEGVLYVVNVSEVPSGGDKFKSFQNLDGKDAIALVKK